MAQSNSRLALDLEEIERQLRQARPASAPAKNDPLAELARIVGQDDPFRAVLSGETRGAGRPRSEDDLFQAAAMHDERARWDAAGREAPQAYDPHYDIGHAAAYQTEDPDYPAAVHDLRAMERSRSRKGLVTVCMVLGVGIVGVGAALTLRGGSSLTADGEPPLVQAEREPLKVRPENPGGVHIPDQNKQIYGAQDGQTKVVNREEQPVDVQQAARALPPAPSAIAPRSAAIVPPTTSPAPPVMAALGEPRRVRTVTVRPDGTFVQPDPSASPTAPRAPAAAAAPPSASGSAPVAVPPQRPRADARTPASATPQAAATPMQPQPPAAAAPEPAPQLTPTPAAVPPALPQRAPQPQRTASIAPIAIDTAPETTSATGNFSIQLAVGFTEPEAQKLAQNIRQRFAGDLGSRSPLIRRAEVNGKTLYRVRVESLSREGATSLCDRVRSSGGQCFVAKN